MPSPIEYVTVARVTDVSPGQVRLVRAGDRWFALANVEGAWHALGNDCPHNGGPLGRGELDGTSLICPWHQWRWDVRSGRNVWPGAAWQAQRVPVRVVGDQVQLPVL